MCNVLYKVSWEDEHYGQKNVQSSAWLTCPHGSFLNNLTYKKANALVHFGQQFGTAWLRSKQPASQPAIPCDLIKCAIAISPCCTASTVTYCAGR